MKLLLPSIIILFLISSLHSQEPDTNFTRRVTAFSWMPDGNSIILNIIKLHKTEKVPPVPSKYLLRIADKSFKRLSIDGSGLVASPDGKTVAYFKRVNSKVSIYHYDLLTGNDKALVEDSLRKFSLSWSGDGNSLAYNIAIGSGEKATTEIMVYNIITGEKKQITQSAPHKSYSPEWNPSNDQITYYLEKGDRRDQIYLTDKNGSFHKNLTYDTSTLNYYPSWIDETTILYTQNPDKQIMLHLSGNKKEAITGIASAQAKFNRQTNKIAYQDKEGRLMIYDLKSKVNTLLLDDSSLLKWVGN